MQIQSSFMVYCIFHISITHTNKDTLFPKTPFDNLRTLRFVRQKDS